MDLGVGQGGVPCRDGGGRAGLLFSLSNTTLEVYSVYQV